jgi:hypothetical protein
MSDIWQTIEQAAVTLGLSVRTVNRHITAGKLESRLFEGRREVRIPASANFGTSAPGPAATNGRVSAEPSVAADTAAEARDPTTASASANGFSSENESSPTESEAFASSPRQRVTADSWSDRPMDTNTFLALADSLDDKATLAVAAYQTLARTAETQVQSLRKAALGAWAVVGVMAVGIIVAVGWGTYRLTTAETTANFLRDKVNEKDQQIQTQAAGRDTELQRIAAERDATREDLSKMRDEKIRLDERAKMLAEQAKAANERAQQAAFVLGQAQTRPTTQPLSATSPGTQPTVVEGSSGGGAASRPAAKSPSPRPTYMTNSDSTFDPK